MSSAITTAPPKAALQEDELVRRLRCPGERQALALCIASNLIVMAVAFIVVLTGAAWLARYPHLAKQIPWVRTVALAAIFALPATVVGRHVNLRTAQANGVRVGEHQLPELYAQLLRACRLLAIDSVPELYVTRKLEVPALAHSLWHGRSVVMLNADFIDKQWIGGLDWLTFAMAGALGSLRLGHTAWWIELLTAYSRSIPGLRTPLLMKWAFSRDRCSAYVVPDGIRGLLVEAVGKDAITPVSPAAFVRQADEPGGFWEFLAGLQRRTPLLTERLRALYAAGFFDRDRDLQRGPTVPKDDDD